LRAFSLTNVDKVLCVTKSIAKTVKYCSSSPEEYPASKRAYSSQPNAYTKSGHPKYVATERALRRFSVLAFQIRTQVCVGDQPVNGELLPMAWPGPSLVARHKRTSQPQFRSTSSWNRCLRSSWKGREHGDATKITSARPKSSITITKIPACAGVCVLCW